MGEVVDIRSAQCARTGQRMSHTLAGRKTPRRYVALHGRIVRSTDGACTGCGCDLSAEPFVITMFYADGTTSRTCGRC